MEKQKQDHKVKLEQIQLEREQTQYEQEVQYIRER